MTAAPPADKSPAPGSPGAWILATRPKTLVASIAPVLIGSAMAMADHRWHVNGLDFHWPTALAALVGAVAIQIGTNLVNDLVDFTRGADNAGRLGPTRVVQAGLLSERAVKWGAMAAFTVAAAVGLLLIARAGWPIAILGLVSILCGVLYTAGPAPLAYVGLGDLFVMAFFGIAAVAGTQYALTLQVDPAAIWLGISTGALATAILAVNNLRDRETDAEAGKRTLAVRMGDRPSRWYIAVLLLTSLAVPVGLVRAHAVPSSVLLVLAATPWLVAPLLAVLGGRTGRHLNPVLGQTAKAQLAHAALLAIGLILDWS